MKIIDDRKIPFSELYIGNSFIYNDSLYVKLYDNKAFNFTDCMVEKIGDDTQTMLVKIEVHVVD